VRLVFVLGFAVSHGFWYFGAWNVFGLDESREDLETQIDNF
jgi:hypothetical protein